MKEKLISEIQAYYQIYRDELNKELKDSLDEEKIFTFSNEDEITIGNVEVFFGYIWTLNERIGSLLRQMSEKMFEMLLRFLLFCETSERSVNLVTGIQDASDDTFAEFQMAIHKGRIADHASYPPDEPPGRTRIEKFEATSFSVRPDEDKVQIAGYLGGDMIVDDKIRDAIRSKTSAYMYPKPNGDLYTGGSIESIKPRLENRRRDGEADLYFTIEASNEFFGKFVSQVNSTFNTNSEFKDLVNVIGVESTVSESLRGLMARYIDRFLPFKDRD